MGLSGFAAGLTAGYAVGDRLGNSLQEGQLRRGLEMAAEVNPETVETTKMSEATPGAGGMVYDSDTGQYLPRYMDGSKPTEQALAQQNGEGASPAGLTPTFKNETTKRYRMGGREQDAPFSQEQIDAQRFRNQADVYSKFGYAEKAATLQGLARTREDEATTRQIRDGAMAGLKNTGDMRDEDKMFATTRGMYETALKLGRPDLASGYYQQMMQNRDALLSRANERAERIYRTTGNIGGYVDTYNKYVADGTSIDAYKANQDGSYSFTVNAGGQAREVNVPREKIGDYLLALRDPKRMSELEAKRAEILLKAQADAQEKLNAPVVVGKDQALVLPATGKVFSPGAERGFDPKDANAVLDDITKLFVSKYGQADPNNPLAPKGLTEEGLAKSSIAQRVYMNNRGLPPAVVAEIADKGSMTILQRRHKETGEVMEVPVMTFNGRDYALGGADAGMPTPQQPATGGSTPQKQTASPARYAVSVPRAEQQPETPQAMLERQRRERATRGEALSEAGFGLKRMIGAVPPTATYAGAAPTTASSSGLQRSTPPDFPRVSQSDQVSRDADAGRLRVAEAGGAEQARRDLAEIDAALKNPRLDGTQRRILQTERNLLASGLAEAS